jgi:hypothetical protein
MYNKHRFAIPGIRTISVRAFEIATALLVAIAAVIAFPDATTGAQAADRSKPPGVEASVGGFTIRRLTSPVTIDGKTWIAIEPIIGEQTVRSPNGQFTITLEEASSVEVVHFRISFAGDGRPPVQIDPGTAVYAFITPDSRWIVNGTLEITDVTNWRKYSLSKVFNIGPYVILKAISADGRQLFISQQDCPFDCRNFPIKYFEIGFPTS